jgi:Polyketide cyclase / dehydrase and lipid transport
MPSAERSRTLAASPAEMWELIADPHHIPRWWPDVRRMEGVEDERWTQVFTTRKGNTVRMDFHLLESDPPGPTGDPPGRRVWEQDLEGSPLARVFGELIIEVRVGADPGRGAESSHVTIEQRFRLRGVQRTGGFMLKRATRRKLDQALDGLEEIVTDR